MKGGRRQGIQKWEDNIKEWTGLDFAKSQRAVENREIWRKLFVKSSVVSQRPSRKRDRWRWRNQSIIPVPAPRTYSCLSHFTPTINTLKYVRFEDMSGIIKEQRTYSA